MFQRQLIYFPGPAPAGQASEVIPGGRDVTVISVGLDVHKEAVTVAVAVAGDDPQVIGTVKNTPGDIRRVVGRLQAKGRLEVVYEAGPR